MHSVHDRVQLDKGRARVLGLPYFWKVMHTCRLKKILIEGNLIKICEVIFKRKNKIFDVICSNLIKSPEPACLRNPTGFTLRD